MIVKAGKEINAVVDLHSTIKIKKIYAIFKKSSPLMLPHLIQRTSDDLLESSNCRTIQEVISLPPCMT